MHLPSLLTVASLLLAATWLGAGEVGPKPVWDLEKAYREATPSRERICLNGLWRWQPAKGAADAVPSDGWGFFKVPGSWPGITDYMQKDCQTVFPHPSWANDKLSGVTAAWYQREITIPKDWSGRMALQADYVNSLATVYVDGKKAGDIRFPGGEVDLTPACRPGAKHVLSLCVIALPLKGVMMSYNDTNAARQAKGFVARRGLCGDVFLIRTTQFPNIGDVRVTTSVRKGEITIDTAFPGLRADSQYALRAQVTDNGQKVAEFTSRLFRATDLKNGRFAFTEKWRPEKLWDIHTPQNTLGLTVSLIHAPDTVLDIALPVRFGFREFWIDGRDFYLNGSRIFLSAVPFDNAQVGAAWASYDGARESMLRLKSFGINCVYTHNYGCEPGSHLSFEEILRAADDVGMLVSLSQPHFGHYDWKMDDADRANGYARHAEFYTRVAGNHPSVVFYSMSHNATGYAEDMNPDMIDGKFADRDPWSLNNVKLALRAEAIVSRLDPSRIIYHHSSGNLSSMHTSNFYPNFVPIQEMSDWFEHWATEGVKPVFTCEYGAPFTWDFAMYRGWFRGKREFGSAAVPWEFCFAEWCAQLLGDRAYRLSEPEKANLRWEAKQARAREGWRRWDYPHEIGSRVFDDRHEVIAMYTTDNWRAFRTWGVSMNSPWEHGHFWRLRPGRDRNARTELKVDWDKLQRPGFSPDYLEDRYERMDLAYELKDWEATADAKALIRNNGPLLAYIAGKPAAFTSKDHNFLPGETVEKQIIVINNSRVPVSCECSWSLALPNASAGEKKLSVETGQQARVPLSIPLPRDLPPGAYKLSMAVKFSTGEAQDDGFVIHVLTPPPAARPAARIALFDPKGETAKLLATMGVAFEEVRGAETPRPPTELLIVGKGALSAKGPGPDITRVRDGLKVIVFEQTSEALEQRLGFRIAEYGLRQVFPRVPDHPALAGLAAENLRDWRGEATILPPRLSYTLSRRYNMTPTVTWCGMEVPRLWRCGNRGNVASVLIEKPACGDWLPIVDGGYSLQYSPLLECREGKGMVLFCQVDVTGRTQSDPAAERLVRNLLNYAGSWKPTPRREVVYTGDPAGRAWLEEAGLRVTAFAGQLKPDQVLVVGPGGGAALAPQKAVIADWLKGGGSVLAIGLGESEARSFLPVSVTMKKGEHIASFFEPSSVKSLLAGIGPADVMNRDPREIDLLADGGVVGVAQGANVVFCQLAAWQFDSERIPTRRTFRRASCLVSRLLGNLGVGAETPLLARFAEPLGAGPRAANLLKNGDFSADADGDGVADGWQVSAEGKSAAAREKLAPDGWAQRFSFAPPPDKKGGTVMLAQHDVPMAKGQWYRISLRAKAEGMKGARVTLTVQNTTTWRPFFDYQEFAPDEAWKAFAFTVQTNDTAAKGTKFQLWHGAPGTLWLADVRMEPCDPPTQGRWLTGLYLDRPEEWDDPYRFFRW